MALIVAAAGSNCCLSVTHKIAKFQKKLKPFFSLPWKSQPISGKAVDSHVGISASYSNTKRGGFPFLGLEEVMVEYISGKKKATEVAHAIWKNIVREGDVVVDATCGNGYDTLALLRLVAGDHSKKGRVYAMDLQKDALETTCSLLDHSTTAEERELVELCSTCHSRMEEIVPSNANVRLVAFNLGYLPGGDKEIKTQKETTLLALEASKRILERGGLISVVAYVGHPGGREELEKVESFAAELPIDHWFCSKLQMLNRPLAPVLVLLYKK